MRRILQMSEAEHIDAVLHKKPLGAKLGVKMPEGKRQSALEREFDAQLSLTNLPAPERDYVFLPDRKFEWDRAWPEQRIAIEIQGNVHRIKARFYADCEKLCLATMAGWRYLPVSRNEIKDGRAIEWLKSLITKGA